VTEQERALELLAGLNADDRSWIVQHLSAGAKSRLMESRQPSVIERLCGADADGIAFVLHSEPAWLVCAILRAHNWPWRKPVLQSLSAAMRAEIARLERQGTALARPALESLLGDLAERVGAPAQVPASSSAFESILERLRRPRHA
jgi:hypothetical protein